MNAMQQFQFFRRWRFSMAAALLFFGVVVSLSAGVLSVIALVEPAPTPIPVPVRMAEPVNLNLPFLMWVAWLGSVGVGLTGLALIWRFIQKASRLVNDMTEYGPVLREIAKEFKSDSGSTLKDSIDRLEKATHDAKATALAAQAMAENLQKLVINKNDET